MGFASQWSILKLWDSGVRKLELKFPTSDSFPLIMSHMCNTLGSWWNRQVSNKYTGLEKIQISREYHKNFLSLQGVFMHFCPKKTNYLSKLHKFPSKKQNVPPDCKISGEGDSPIPHLFPSCKYMPMSSIKTTVHDGEQGSYCFSMWIKMSNYSCLCPLFCIDVLFEDIAT